MTRRGGVIAGENSPAITLFFQRTCAKMRTGSAEKKSAIRCTVRCIGWCRRAAPVQNILYI